MAFTIIPTRIANVDPASAADFNALMGNTQYNYDNKYLKTDFINSTAGIANADEPIKTDSSGLVDDSFLDNAVLEAELINNTAGIADAGKPIKTDSAGVIDSSFYTDTKIGRASCRERV